MAAEELDQGWLARESLALEHFSVLIQGAEHRDWVSDLDGVCRHLLATDRHGERKKHAQNDCDRGGQTAKPTGSEHEGADAKNRGSDE